MGQVTSLIAKKTHSILELEGLRGWLAIGVLLGHWGTTISRPLSPLPQNLFSREMVDVFIVLSGFVITSLFYRNRTGGLSAYLLRRWFRLWPAFACMSLAAVGLLPFTQDVLIASPASVMKNERLQMIQDAASWPFFHLITHLTLLHGLVPVAFDRFASYTLLGQGWSISLEWQFYLLAPLIFLCMRKKTLPAIVALFLMLAVLMFSGRFFEAAFIGNKLPYFAAGWASYLAWQWQSDHPARIPVSILRIAALLIVFAALALHRIGLCVWTVIFAITLLSRYTSARLERVLCRPLLHSVSQFLGSISYTLYLVHFHIMMVVLGGLERFRLSDTDEAAALLAGTLALSLPAAYLLSVAVERPGMRLGQYLSSRGNLAAL